MTRPCSHAQMSFWSQLSWWSWAVGVALSCWAIWDWDRPAAVRQASSPALEANMGVILLGADGPAGGGPGAGG